MSYTLFSCHDGILGRLPCFKCFVVRACWFIWICIWGRSIWRNKKYGMFHHTDREEVRFRMQRLKVGWSGKPYTTNLIGILQCISAHLDPFRRLLFSKVPAAILPPADSQLNCAGKPSHIYDHFNAATNQHYWGFKCSPISRASIPLQQLPFIQGFSQLPTRNLRVVVPCCDEALCDSLCHSSPESLGQLSARDHVRS